MVWMYLCDECDHAGIWIADFDVASLQLGFKVDAEKLEQWLGDKLTRVNDDRYFIPSFFEFQYGNAKDGFTAKQSALKRLRALGLADDTSVLPQSKDSPPTVQPQSLDCTSVSVSKSNSVLEKGSGEKPLREVTAADLEEAYKAYPLKKGKSKGIDSLKRQIKTRTDLADLKRAIAVYANEVKGREPDKIKHFSTFANGPWRDCLDPTYGQASVGTGIKADLTNVKWSG